MINELHRIASRNPWVDHCLSCLAAIDGPEFWVGAGALTQGVWNHLFGLPPEHGLTDIDIVYCDLDNQSEAAEAAVIQGLNQRIGPLPLPLDIKNQGRVHQWYQAKFGIPIPAVASVQAAVDLWPSTASSVILRRDRAGAVHCYAPFGLDDLFAGIVRANKRQITKEIYAAKCQKWQAKWPGLTVIPWDQSTK